MVDIHPKLQQKNDQRERLRAASPPDLPRIRVWPRSDVLRKHLKHPSGIGFPSTGSANWPHDTFTRRRIVDGGVLVSDPDEEAPTEQTATTEPAG